MEPKTIAERAAKLGFPAIALTDRNGLYGAMPFSDACIAKGVQPIIGAMLGVARPPEIGGEAAIDWLALLAQGRAGLCQSLQAGLVGAPRPAARGGAACRVRDARGPERRADRADRRRRRARSRGCSPTGSATRPRPISTGCRRCSPAGSTSSSSAAAIAVEEAAEEALIELAYARDLPLVATNPAAYADPSFHAAHDAMLCIANSAYVESADRVTSSPDAWLKDGAAMAELFADLPEAIANTAVIAQRCAVARAQAQADPAAPRRRRGRAAAPRCARRASPTGSQRAAATRSSSAYLERLDFELDVITGMGFAGYFLIVADFIKWAKAQRHSGRAGPRLGRGLGRRLVADHHRPRPDRARPAVRALPQPRARVDARLRHRLLRNPPRQGDPLRPAASTAATRSRRSSPSGG